MVTKTISTIYFPYKQPSIITYCNYDVHGNIICDFVPDLVSIYDNPVLNYIFKNTNMVVDSRVYTCGQTYRPHLDVDISNKKKSHKILAVTKIGNYSEWVVVDRKLGIGIYTVIANILII